MVGIWLENQHISVREDLAEPVPANGEALVKMRMAGICATDLELIQGYYPFTGVIGHEFVGEIIRADAQPARIGERVVGEINARCGHCTECRAGRVNHCRNRTVLGIVARNGCFAEYLVLPIENLIPVPDRIPDEQAVFTEPLAAALEIQEQVEVRPRDRVLVIGAGRLGQLIAQTLRLTGCELRVIARHANQRALLNSQGIAVLDENQIPDRAADIVVEATGSQSGYEAARRAVRPGGTIVLKSTYRGELSANFSAIVVDEITLVGSRCGPFQPALRLLAENLVDPVPLIVGRFSFRDGLAGFEHARQPGGLKVILTPDGR